MVQLSDQQRPFVFVTLPFQHIEGVLIFLLPDSLGQERFDTQTKKYFSLNEEISSHSAEDESRLRFPPTGEGR